MSPSTIEAYIKEIRAISKDPEIAKLLKADIVQPSYGTVVSQLNSLKRDRTDPVCAKEYKVYTSLKKMMDLESEFLNRYRPVIEEAIIRLIKSVQQNSWRDDLPVETYTSFRVGNYPKAYTVSVKHTMGNPVMNILVRLASCKDESLGYRSVAEQHIASKPLEDLLDAAGVTYTIQPTPGEVGGPIFLIQVKSQKDVDKINDIVEKVDKCASAAGEKAKSLEENAKAERNAVLGHVAGELSRRVRVDKSGKARRM
jgi:hypothetical protein